MGTFSIGKADLNHFPWLKGRSLRQACFDQKTGLIPIASRLVFPGSELAVYIDINHFS